MNVTLKLTSDHKYDPNLRELAPRIADLILVMWVVGLVLSVTALVIGDSLSLFVAALIILIAGEWIEARAWRKIYRDMAVAAALLAQTRPAEPKVEEPLTEVSGEIEAA
jgi:hypothetical protein